MFEIASSEMVLIAAIALIAIGPKQLPEVARTLGKMLNELKRQSGDFTNTFLEARDTTNKLFSDAQKSMLDSVLKTGGEIQESLNVKVQIESVKTGATLAQTESTITPPALEAGHEPNLQPELPLHASEPPAHMMTAAFLQDLEHQEAPIEEQLSFDLPARPYVKIEKDS